MSQYPSPWSSAPTEPYYGLQSTQSGSFSGSSSNPTPPALRAGAASDYFMSAGTPYDYTHDPSIDGDVGFSATAQNIAPSVTYDGYQPVSSLGSVWPSSGTHAPPHLPFSNVNPAQTLGQFDMSTAMSDPNYFGRIASLTEEAGQDEHGGLQQATLGDDTENRRDTMSEIQFSQVTPRMPSPSPNEGHVTANPRKARGKTSTSKKSDPEQISPVFTEPDATYDFAVTDKDDVFLDPKPVAEFGTHEPHLVQKVSDAARDLKKQEQRDLQTSTIPGHQQALWHSPRNDFSIPTTPTQYNVCFDLLVKAIDYVGEDVVEKRNTKEFQRRWIDREHYDEGFVQALAKQVLDTMIDVHQNGWTYYVQDPSFRLMYHKTMYFTFRDRFNVTALVLKYSKTTCDGILKGQRLYDVIGNSYHLETRVTSNKKANSDRAVRLAMIKETEKNSGKTRTKRARNAGEDEGLSNETKVPTKPSKRTKVAGGTRLSADASNHESAVSATEHPTKASRVAATQVRTDVVKSRSRAATASSVGRRSTKTSKKRSKKATASESIIPDDDSALPNSAEVSPGDGARNHPTAGSSVQNSDDAPTRRKSSKRAFSQVHEDEQEEQEPVAAPAKKAKPSSRPVALAKKRSVKARAKSTASGQAQNEDAGSDVEDQPSKRGKRTAKAASSSRPKRAPTRSRKPAAGSSADHPTGG
ncbi:hypothetical protein EKO04_011423 [Ascochyta lentis]|uniref:Uncharacterized protein n=1 Tax=Ascochyta lentis TaxID=205686 RepID=A0A8H7ITB0_9PLEO|nr:hypothetical protein EKO04_011423 [Ascochyta lentis]